MAPKATTRSTALLKTLRAVIEEHRPLTARYYGNARIDVLQLLVDSLARGAVQAMACGGNVTTDQRIELYHHGVVWWDEGSEAAELDVRDHSWGSRQQIQKIVDFHEVRAPRIWVLADEATEVELPDAYTWEQQKNGMIVGVRRESRPEIWAKAETLRHDRIATTRSWLRMHGYSVPFDPPDADPSESTYDIPLGSPQVTCEAWQRLSPEERERRERGATLMKASHSSIPFYAERAAKRVGDKYWAELFDQREE